MTDNNSLRSTIYRTVSHPLAIVVLLVALSLYESTFRKVGRDQGVWTYMGWVWEAHGIAPYSGSMDNKTPGIHMLYAIFVRYFGIGIWPHAVASAAACMVAALLIYALARRLYDRTAGALAALLFALTVTSPALDGALYVEPFVILFSTFSFFLILTPRGATQPAGSGRLVLAGLSMGCAIAFKQTACFDALALLIVSGVIARKRGEHSAGVVRGLALITAGLGISTLLCLVPLLSSGTTLYQYWEGGWVLLLKPGTAAKLANRIYNFVCVWGGMKARLPLFYPLLLLFVLQRERLRLVAVPCGCLLLWLGLVFVGCNASGQLWGHQVQQILPVLAVIAGIALERHDASRLCRTVAPPHLRTVGVRHGTRSLGTDRSLRGRVLADLLEIERRNPTRRSAEALGALAQRACSPHGTDLRLVSRCGRHLCLRGKSCALAVLPQSFCGQRGAVAEIQAALQRVPPHYVVVEREPYPAIPAWLQEWIDRNYTPRDKVLTYEVYQRNSCLRGMKEKP